MAQFENLSVFTGNAHPELAGDICGYLGMTLGRCDVSKFANDNTFVRIMENVRERDVFLVQPSAVPVDQNLIELLIMIDAAKRASAGRITAVVPYYPYGRSDKKDQPRVPITARLVANLITTAGADRLLTMDLHAGQIQGFFNIPVDELTAVRLLSRYFLDKGLDDIVVVAPDVGGTRLAREFADHLNAPIAIVEKQRFGNDDRSQARNLIGDVDGRPALIVDDEIVTGGTVVNTMEVLRARGAEAVYCAGTHAVFCDGAADRLSLLDEVVVTDTLSLTDEQRFDGLTVLSVASLLGEAIHRIHSGLSVGAMFEK